MKRNATPVGKRRGVALLLVMVGLVVCTLLTAGFLSTQGTSIAIARNERDAEQCRMLAQAGIDLCFDQIRTLDKARLTADQPGWREKMSPGTWLSNFAIGAGTVTVTAHSAGAADSFTADYHQPVKLTSTGYVNNRQFTLTAIISPTGGGEVFRGGNFFASTVVVGSGGLPLLAPIAIIDSYNSQNGKYVSSDKNAVVWSNSTSAGSITINTNSILDGNILAGPTALLSSVLNLLGSLLGGGNAKALAAEPRDPGIVLPPNANGLASQGTFNLASGTLSPGIYDAMNVAAGTGVNASLPAGVYVDKGDFNVLPGGNVVIQKDGYGNANTVLYVEGNVTLGSASTITVNTGCTLTLYVHGSVTITSGTVSATGTNPLPSQVQILGLPSSNSIKITSGTVNGVIYAPQASVQLKNASVVQGAIVANDVTLLNTSKFHYDEDTKKIKISNITGGTAPPGAADYTIAVH